MAPVIREASADDVADLVVLFAQLGYRASADEVGLRLKQLADDRHSLFLVASEDGRVVGAVTLYFVPVAHQSRRWCRLTALVVDEQARGRGVGRALVAAAEEAARAVGCVRVEATSASAPAPMPSTSILAIAAKRSTSSSSSRLRSCGRQQRRCECETRTRTPARPARRGIFDDRFLLWIGRGDGWNAA